eukprot:Ihof_evm1s668 gene=Ihof_evmTU1s668
MTSEVFEIVEGGAISTHSFNGDRTKVCLSANSNDIRIYGKKGANWVLEHTLLQHDQRVTAVHWAPNSDRIVSCAQDRNAYVWSKDQDGKWKPTLVLLRINRAATCVKWSPQENKFAVGCGARLICVCYFDEENDWWVAKHIKENILSTVLTVDWHPNGAILAAGSADFKTYLFSCAIKGIDKKPAETAWGTSDKMRSWGCMLQQYTSAGNGWVHGVAFSPSGNQLAWVSHAATISFVDSTVSTESCETVLLPSLPLRSILFTSEMSVVAAGYDCIPYLFSKTNNTWKMSRKIDEPSGDEKKKGSVFAAMDRFKQLDSRATNKDDTTNLNSIHQNAV